MIYDSKLGYVFMDDFLNCVCVCFFFPCIIMFMVCIMDYWEVYFVKGITWFIHLFWIWFCIGESETDYIFSGVFHFFLRGTIYMLYLVLLQNLESNRKPCCFGFAGAEGFWEDEKKSMLPFKGKWKASVAELKKHSDKCYGVLSLNLN